MKIALALLALFAAGCGSSSRRPPIQIIPDMRNQAKYKPQQANAFFADGRASRAPVPGTVPRDAVLDVAAERPALSRELLARGQERFDIYCSVCHDRTGGGQGIVALRGGWIATNLTDQRIKAMPDEEIYRIISNGVRTMPGYRFQVAERDRWAIVSYVRALQRASAGTLEDVPQELRSDLR